MLHRSRSRRRRRATVVLVAALVAVTAAACQKVPETGRYSTEIYSDAQLTAVMDLQYGSAVDHQGTTVPLRLDLYLPPDGPTARPVVIAIHGGSFTGGNRGQMASVARSYARRGFAAATISYRLDPRASSGGSAFFLAVLNAVDDGMESVRWLKSKATAYHLDSTRVAMVGSSAGGGVAMGVALFEDPTPTGPLTDYTPKIRAAVSTGANMTPAFEMGATAESTDAPVHMFHHDLDTATGQTFEYAFGTCVAMAQAGATCGMTRQPGSGHTVSLSAGGTWWKDPIAPFLWKHMDLHSLPA